MPTRIRRLGAAAIAAAVVVPTGCTSNTGDGGSVLLPTVAEIDDALSAVATDVGEGQRFFEVSAHLTGVTVIVAVDDADDNPATNEAVSYAYVNGDLGDPVTLGVGEGSTFTADAVDDLDPSRIFDGVRAQIDDPVVTDFAITAGPDSQPIYDCTMRSGKGGQLRARLAPDGSVLEVMAE